MVKWRVMKEAPKEERIESRRPQRYEETELLGLLSENRGDDYKRIVRLSSSALTGGVEDVVHVDRHERARSRRLPARIYKKGDHILAPFEEALESTLVTVRLPLIDVALVTPRHNHTMQPGTDLQMRIRETERGWNQAANGNARRCLQHATNGSLKS